MPDLVSMSQQFSGLPMESLISAPLNATVKANTAMAATQTKFMLDTCFTKEVTGENTSYKPIMITMKLKRPVITPPERPTNGGQLESPTITTAEISFDLPLISIIPLNSLAVKTAEIHFEMEVKSSVSDDVKESSSNSLAASTSFEAKVGYGCFSASVSGKVSYDQKNSSEHDTHYEKSNSAKYTLGITAGQLPLPKGVTTIIDAFSKAVDPITVRNETRNLSNHDAGSSN